jgi:acetyl esterase/lipase
MHRSEKYALILSIFLAVSASPVLAAPSSPPAHEVLRLWSGQAPGTENWSAPEEEADVTLPGAGKIHVITNVTVPTLTVVRPAQANGTAMVVLPGGSFRALAWDVDGLETAQWLASTGITAFVLKYRVRPPQEAETFGRTLQDFATATRTRRAIAVADAKQAIRLIRSRARQYGVNPKRVGVIGFSAGAMASVEVALGKDNDARPNFAVLMYGAALTDKLPGKDSPPLFIGAAQDDPQLPASNSAEVFQRWTNAGAPAELHIFERGGHGFGFRRHGSTSDAWPTAFRTWLTTHGLMQPTPRAP